MNDLDKKTDALLKNGWVSPPVEFRDSVMQNIAAFEREQESMKAVSPTVSVAVPWWQWLALTAGSLVGIGQVLRFIFSVWFVTSAG